MAGAAPYPHLPPIAIDPVLPDPGLVRRLVEANAPYAPVQRYFSSGNEQASMSGGRALLIAPNFRGDWAYEKPRIEGVEPLFHHEGFLEAARTLYGGGVVRPQQVYANLTWQLPFDQGEGHVDVPAFRGIERTEFPIWLLGRMGHSRLFERYRVRIATAVAWFYEGADGGFEYWPDGPEAPSKIHEGDIFNTAMLGDNDFMFHRVRPVGRREDGLPQGLTLDSRLERADEADGWKIVDRAREIGRFAYDALRISVSWKGMVFQDAEEARLYDEGRDTLDLAAVVQTFTDDLEARGVPFEAPRDPLRDPAFVDVLMATYHRAPPQGRPPA